MSICISNFQNLAQRYRTTLVNSVAGFKALNLVGTVSQDGKTNLAVFNSIFHVGANPPLLGMVVRPDSVDRHTLKNIEDSKLFTLNHVTRDIYRQAHQTSARYGKEESEFDATGLGVFYDESCEAPMVAESPVKMILHLEEIIRVKSNDTIIVIGAIQKMFLPETTLGEDGFVDLNKAGSITVAGLDAYYETRLLERLPYAKPGVFTREVGMDCPSSTEVF